MTHIDPSYDQSVSSIHNRLFFRLFQAGNTLDRQTIKALGITTVQWSVLGALSRQQAADGMSFSELADYLVVSRQSLDGVLKRLEREEHVRRVADTVDRRAKIVVMTPQGRAFWDSLQPKIYEFYRQALASFRFDDKVSLVHFLNQLNKGMGDVNLGETAAGDARDAAVSAHEDE
ncbi:MarR family winged helix-turn-helix transcriptional regulator [Burkholderia stagnalis]|uniref:MarR family winged helix-turn-helix transcriptional regulator n=1 Tax=Burkholderia stagnalis TaxID=1503054 RepID=UPI0007570CD9|nr:MarR family transcriptional regulator [Burkholderia stagnalis]KVC56020.1 MarR family transcriptional regulator [Burkholderia stagnalis]KVN12147.1 MarR family transcriptional regulator [Burkholderia stagnalis]KWI75402.1 MarR family transcriptional regulator [Burkholderia stagnalis]KWK62828.1 MarR family transcriptional regulator [Burkholderia stagnalis]KWN24727.1 MarR family transcriptional regulator [Burkholderia stagnalis]